MTLVNVGRVKLRIKDQVDDCDCGEGKFEDIKDQIDDRARRRIKSMLASVGKVKSILASVEEIKSILASVGVVK